MNPYRLESDPTDDVINLDAPTVCLEAQRELLINRLNNPYYDEVMLGKLALDLLVVEWVLEDR